MADLKGTEWTNAFLTPREPDDPIEIINREFNFAGTPADSDTLMLVKIPIGYKVIDILIEIVTAFEGGASNAEVGAVPFNSETGAIGSVSDGDADCYLQAIAIGGGGVFRFPNDTNTSVGRVPQTVEECVFLTFPNLATPAAGVLNGIVTMASTGL